MSSVAVKSEEVIMENAEYNSAEELDEELQLQLEDTGGESYIQYEHDSMERRQSTGMSGGGSVGGPPPSKSALESEKRMRREIANSNERRRMQSINAGFQNLRALLPRHEGEKLSKAAILQQTSQYICELEDQKTQLLAQNSQLKRQLGQHEVSSGGGTDTAAVPDTLTTSGGVAIKKRKLTDNVINMQTISDSSDEGLGSMSPEPMTLLHANSAAANGKPNSASAAAALIAHNATKELIELKKLLEKERLERNMLEDQLNHIKQEQEFTYVTTPQMPQSHQQHHQQQHHQQQQHHHQQQHQLELEQQQLEQQQLDQHHLQQQQQQHQQSHPLHLTDYGSLSRHEVIEHTDNIMRDDELPMVGNETYVEIDGSVVVCSSIEELVDSETAGAADIITEDHQLQDEVLLSSHSSTESEQEVAVNAIAKVYAEGGSPASAVLQPILQAAIKATPKVEVERIIESVSSGINVGGLIKVKTEKIEQPTSGLTRSRQNLETIVEAIRHLEGDHLFGDVAEQHKQQQQQQQLLQLKEEPLALTTTTNVTAMVQGATGGKRNTLAELRPYLQLKPGGGVVSVAGNKQMTITVTSSSGGNSSQGAAQAAAIANSSNNSSSSKNSQLQKESSHIATPTAILKVQTSCANNGGNNTTSATAQQITIISTALKQCRPGVIVAKQLS